MHPLYEATKGLAYATLATIASCENSKAKVRGYRDGWEMLMDLHDKSEMALFCTHLPRALSETQSKILLDGLAQQYTQFNTWGDFVEACTEHPSWVPSRGPIEMKQESSTQ
jgi:hypothetical protein